MENLFVYLIKTSGLLTLFFLAYYIFIKKETFFNASRFFLIGGIITSALLPLLVYTKIVWITPVVTEAPLFTHQNFTATAQMAVPHQAFEINWWYVAAVIYALGVLFFFVRLIANVYKITSLFKDQQKVYTDGFIMINSPSINAPFSFFKYIVYNSALLTPNELENIIAHEKTHSRQWHSLDMLLNQVTCALLWFNPISWLYKQQAVQNLEFIADAQATKCISDLKAYQKTLLKITLQPECIAITNHFYQSLIKKRIIMLNKKQSKRLNIIKFAFILPAIGAFFYLFQTEVVAQEREVKKVEKENTIEEVIPENQIAYGTEITYPIAAATTINHNLSKKVMKERKEMYKDIFEADIFFKNIKRNKKGEITAITVMVKDKNNIKSYPVYEITSDDDTPIHPFILNIERLSKESENIISFKEIAEGKETAPISVEVKNDAKSEILNPEDYINSRMQNRDVIIIINGEIQKSKYLTEPLGEKFETIIELDAKSALKKYNVKAKDGAIVLTTKKIENPVSSSGYSTSEPIRPLFNNNINTSITKKVEELNNSPYRTVTVTKAIVSEGESGKSNGFSIIETLKSKGMDFNKAYLKLNGKEVTEKEITEAMNNKILKNVSTSLGGGEYTEKKYGHKAFINGFLVVETYD